MREKKVLKFNLRFWLSIILALAMLSTSLMAFAYEGNGTDIPTGSGGKSILQGGASANKSGYLCYITDASGGIQSAAYYLDYAGGVAGNPAGVHPRLSTGTNATHRGSISAATNGSWNNPPFTFGGGTYGGSLKGWMLEKHGDVYNAGKFLENVFGMTGQEFIDGDLVLNIEAVAWSRLDTAHPTQVGYTAYYIAKWYSEGKAKHPLLNSFWLNRFQTCGMLERSWAGLNAPSSNSVSEKASNTSGYGIIQVRASDLDGEIEPPDPPEPVVYDSDDFIRPDEVNVVVTDMIQKDWNLRDFDQYEDTLTGSLENIKTWDGWVEEESTHETDEDDYGNTVVTNHHYIKYGTVADSSDIIEDDVFHVDDTTEGVVDEYGHYLWCEDALADESEYEDFVGEHEFDLDTTVCPGFGYNYSKAAWGETQYIADHRTGNLVDLAEDLHQKADHKLSEGADVSGSFDAKGLEKPKEGMIPGSKDTTEKFTAWATENYHEQEYYDDYDIEYHTESGYDDPDDEDEDGDLEYWEETYEEFTNITRVNVIGDEDTYEDFQATPTFEDFITYDSTHKTYKYTCAGLETAHISGVSDGGAPFAGNHTQVSWTTEVPSKLTVNPEVKYSVWRPAGDGSVSKSSAIKQGGSRSDIWIMGEKARGCYPAAIHGYKVTNMDACANTARTLLDAPLTGTSAKDISSANDNVQVSAQGSGFQLALTNLPIVHTYSAQLSLNDGGTTGGKFNGSFSPLEEWGASTGESEHIMFTDNLNNNLVTEVDLKYSKANTSGEKVKDSYVDSQRYTLTHSTQTNQVIHVEKKSYWLNYCDGAITYDGGLDSALKTAFGSSASVETIWGGQIRAMFEDKDESKTQVLNLKTYKGDAPYDPGKWYQEDSVCFVVNFYHSKIILGDLLLSDKNDYGTVEQKGTKQEKGNMLYDGKSAAIANFKFKLFHIENTLPGDSDNPLDVSSVKYLIGGTDWQGLDLTGAKFAVSTQTTTSGH